MKYSILNYANEQDYASGKIDIPAFAAYAQALTEAGVMIAATGLQPSRTATTVRIQNGHRNVQDGPFADTKEQLGGFYVIDVPDLDTALEWAARNPAASLGGVEVRPITGIEVRPATPAK
ncbi:YciI family protein [Rivularia sp. UHCC 0363]|uniref:YciI family protein n=1 Tax=Rivularia sp. UHCC 0363 TaxID=3110244 RepID=UPI002B1ECFAC|nr:YciI family protein [Rivularia sp. UHCC 0363]MEA5597134.1 YciI family protein [Rivularia sp. UHCC 0363]